MSVSMSISGRINKVQASGTLDGPGLRFVIFLQGCLFRCQYCHNPETMEISAGQTRTVESLIEEIEEYRSFFNASNGGVTVSGGEPLLQKHFVAKLFSECRARGIHTALDTNGFTELDSDLDAVLACTDLVILDLKSIADGAHIELTGQSNERTLAFARYLNAKTIPTWVRQVIVHPFTDTVQSAQELAKFIAPMSNIDRIELVSFHNMAAEKWKSIPGFNYVMLNTKPPSMETMELLAAELRKFGLQPICD